MMNSQEMSGTGAQDAHSGGSLSFRAVATPRAVIFDLGGTLVHWSDWDNSAELKWAASYDHLVTQFADRKWPSRDGYVMAMRESEREHWRRVDTEHWSGPPTGLVREGFDRLGVPVSGAELLGAMDGYAKAIAGWSTVDPDAMPTLALLRERGYRLGLLSNTWWAADWHNADLATHGLAGLIDVIVYTSDLPHSKPHRSVFHEVASFGSRDVTRLLKDTGIIRNRAKIEAAVANARAFLTVQREFGTFDAYVWRFTDKDKLSKELRARGFRFVGPTIVESFMQAV